MEDDNTLSEELFSQQLAHEVFSEASTEDLNLYGFAVNELKNAEGDENIDDQLKVMFCQMTEEQI